MAVLQGRSSPAPPCPGCTSGRAGRIYKRTFVEVQGGGLIAKRHRANELFLVNMSRH
jgi:hypothetical protein